VRLLVVLLAVLALAGCGVSRSGAPAPSTYSFPSTSAAGVDVDGCEFVEKPAEDAPIGLPPNESTSASRVTFGTSAGELTVTLGAQTPCTVRSFVHLADGGFYDGTVCHRLTASAGLKVLQCGDPIGDGTGGPGYTIPDELPTDLTPASTDPGGQQLVFYPRGTVAMANAGPDTGGSQFFMVYGDSTLPPNYTVFGTVDPTGMATLDTVAAGGLTPVNGPEDGTPRLEVRIETATVS
jgi:peptidyl-prolyl cis-trans isomerase B (cyclophilin B)